MSALEVTPPSDLARLAGEANASHRKAGESIVSAIIHGLEAGRALVAAQALVPYGQWSPWLSANFKGSDRSARRWMRLYRERDRLPGGDPLRTRVSELTPSRALTLLAAKEEPDPAPLTPEQEARFHELEGVIRRGVGHGAEAWQILRRRIGAHPEGWKALHRAVAAARIGPPLPVSRPDLRHALETWSEHDLVYRLLYANERQHRLCGRILLAIEARGRFRPRFETFDQWREESGWAGDDFDGGIAWARANPDTPAEQLYSEADCCRYACRLMELDAERGGDAPATPEGRPTESEHEAFNAYTAALMLVGAAAGWPWVRCSELFARAMEELAPVAS